MASDRRRLAGVVGCATVADMRSGMWLGVLAFVLLLGGCKRGDPGPKAPGEALVHATELARGMGRYDLIAWWATDALLAAKTVDPTALRGWLVMPGSTATGEARMIGEVAGGELGVVASVGCDVSAGPTSCVVAREFAARPLTAEEQTMLRAIETAEADPLLVRAQESYNKIVLRAADYGLAAGWIVYIVASTTDPEVIPVGRHFRFDVSADGRRVLGRRASHRGVIMARRSVEGGTTAAVMSSAVFDAQPSEFQMYVSIVWRIAVGMIGCDGSLWMVEGLKVERLEAARETPVKCVDPWRE